MHFGESLIRKRGGVGPYELVEIIQTHSGPSDLCPVIVDMMAPGIAQVLTQVDPKVGAVLDAVQHPVELRLSGSMGWQGIEKIRDHPLDDYRGAGFRTIKVRGEQRERADPPRVLRRGAYVDPT
jgi:hypothetical protein